jgi:trans-2,3-dihydro-3-hydroxyanthranilate isomerase
MAMACYDFHTVDVFTARRFGGNPLAVFPAAQGLDDATMQALAAELNYSETAFVLPPCDSAHDARVRIFNRTAEMPFAGHPNVGTAFVLARLGLARGPVLRFEEMAGLVEVRLTETKGEIVGAEIDAPQPLFVQEEVPVERIAACMSIAPHRIATSGHPPIRAGVGVDFVLAEVAPDALRDAAPDLGSFRRLAADFPQFGGRLSVFPYALDGDGVRARMFAPLAGTWEDAATGSANAALAALRLHRSGADSLTYEAVQGVEMGRESRLALRAWRAPDGVRAGVGGACVSVFSGTVSL